MTHKNGVLREFTYIGGYPIAYLIEHEVFCAQCAQDIAYGTEAKPVDAFVNWEDPYLYCDACSSRIESAYAE